MTVALLERLGRQRNYNLVCDSFHPELRSNTKFKRWDRKLKRARFNAMTENEKRFLSAILEFRFMYLPKLRGL